MKYMVQSDFDGTLTVEDISYMLLDEFARGDWRSLLAEYEAGRMAVGTFNTRAFAMVRETRETLLDFVLNSGKVKIREGLPELLDCCATNGLDFTIVSNGQDFYVEAILNKLGLNNIKFHSARSRFTPERVEAHYIGPNGSIVTDCFKETYARLFLQQGYRLIYIGNGLSDVYPAKLADYVFAISDMMEQCLKIGLPCHAFNDLHDIVRELNKLQEASPSH
jgi:2-hydroxy-3-keto-5-methylthiopentenyl-1-phosphate phosphatase